MTFKESLLPEQVQTQICSRLLKNFVASKKPCVMLYFSNEEVASYDKNYTTALIKINDLLARISKTKEFAGKVKVVQIKNEVGASDSDVDTDVEQPYKIYLIRTDVLDYED